MQTQLLERRTRVVVVEVLVVLVRQISMVVVAVLALLLCVTQSVWQYLLSVEP
jgi:hypothetical protein